MSFIKIFYKNKLIIKKNQILQISSYSEYSERSSIWYFFSYSILINLFINNDFLPLKWS